MIGDTSAGLRPIRKQPAEQLVAAELRRLITTAQLPPGSRLVEASVSQQLAISRSTLRAALHQLSQEGLVVQTPYTGWTVMSIRPQDLWELYTLRAALESMAGQLAIEKLTPAGAQALEDAFEQLQLARHKREPDEVVVERDFNIHKTIVELAGHRRLREHYRMVEQQIRLFVASTYVDMKNKDTTLDTHGAIVEAIVQKNTQEATRLLHEHSSGEGRRVFGLLSSVLAEKAADQ
ncbi:MAG: GntR family transcriptional regulator [Ramlibacter sp.]